ncbi:MAG: helix-hairpin-helix domain-containing protein [Candidatus Brocadiales bacterium]|uniref:ComEA family DNA-binding protein n=1 Tax=Candidatus Wunengus sp. YC60 TaxID=3367697 RepID=UPI002713A7A6|nr:helix-hairpin-helix domain-containing protein [Candidatus Brocadiales bacterium]
MRIIDKSFWVVILVIVVGSIWQARFCLSVEQVEGKVNINTATESQIALLPGLGPKLATEVVNYRANNGNFKTIEDIKKVSGVGDKKFEKIKDYVVLEGETTIKSTKPAKGEKESK